jgi:3-oxoacyl-[acyl-carrier protein] reductase
VEIYVSNAAPKPLYKDFFQTTDEDWLGYLHHRLDASWYLAKAFMPGMRDRGWAG